MINVQIKNFIISYSFIVKFCRGFLILSLCFPPPGSMHFSPLLCASAVSLSHLLSPCCVHPLFLPTTPLCMFAIYLSPPPAESIHCLSPCPQYVHPSCIFLCSAHETFPSSSYCHSYPPSFACLPSCPLLYFSSPPSCTRYPCSSLYYSPFHLFDILVPSVSLSAPLFSQAPLCTISLQFSLICSHKLILQEKCSCLQGCASPHCKPFSTVSNLRQSA